MTPMCRGGLGSSAEVFLKIRCITVGGGGGGGGGGGEINFQYLPKIQSRRVTASRKAGDLIFFF